MAAASPAAQPSAVAPTPNAAAPALAGIVIEIANGTRDTGLGEYVAKGLRLDGATVVRVTGLKPYTQRRNVIFYREGFHEQALAVSRRFANPPAVVAGERGHAGSDQPQMRLVLGKSALQSTQAADGSTPEQAL